MTEWKKLSNMIKDYGLFSIILKRAEYHRAKYGEHVEEWDIIL